MTVEAALAALLCAMVLSVPALAGAPSLDGTPAVLNHSTSSTTSIACPTFPSVGAGDTCLLYVEGYNGTGSAWTPTGLSAWTEIGSACTTASDAGASASDYLYYKTSTGSDASPTIGGSQGYMICTITCFAGTNTSSPTNGTPQCNDTLTPPNLTTSLANDLNLQSYFSSFNGCTISLNGSLSSVYNSTSTYSAALGSQTESSSGTVNGLAATCSGGTLAISHNLALAAAPTPTPTPSPTPTATPTPTPTPAATPTPASAGAMPPFIF
ncbi:MAG: hypothetical protein ACHQZS_11835 [Candidatus Binatales bacterium]